MDVRESFLIQHAHTHAAEVGRPDLSTQDLTLRDVREEQMKLRPRPGFDSLAWLLWHMTHAEDVSINLVIAERPQVLDEGDWPARLNTLRRDAGTGMTAAEVDAFNERIDVDALLAYRGAVGHRTRDIVRDLPPDMLDEGIDAALVQ
jgi:hypothetical protein